MAQKKNDYVSVNLLPISILLAAIIVSGTILFTQNKKKDDVTNDNVQGTQEEGFMYAELSIDDDAYKGNKDDAKYAIVEFSDYECPYCKRHAQEVLPSIQKNYIDTDDLIYVFRDFPLPFHGEIAEYEPQAGTCIQKEYGNKEYFQYHDALYEKTESNASNMTNELVLGVVEDLGFDSDKVTDCISEGKAKDEMQK
ncbi:MAG: thioredoxin domain-containing protein, partial [bacterium]